VNGFFFSDADIADRGYLNQTASRSPIRYLTTGTAPNRIFKLEIANGGFYNEYDFYNTMSDSFSLQVWVYETSNIVELHYGPSRITHAADYFNFGNGPLVMYAKHADFDMGTAGSVYFLEGAASAPALDSVDLPNQPATALNSWPASGKVYRFTPTASCTAPSAGFTAGAPSGKTVQYTYTGTATGLDSLVWNFGDGQKQKVTSGFTTPVTHIFAANGHYTVSVTAYNSCGPNTFTKQLALSIGNIALLGNVQVYPNPANDHLTIEGMEAGGRVVVYSMTGRQLLTGSITGNVQALPIAALPAGSYMLVLSGRDGRTASLKFVKQ
jgi:hypothetical protein